jgi:hypothetical protein
MFNFSCDRAMYVTAHWIDYHTAYPAVERQSREDISESKKERIKHIYLSTHEATRIHDSMSANSSCRWFTSIMTGRCAKEVFLLTISKKNRGNWTSFK